MESYAFVSAVFSLCIFLTLLGGSEVIVEYEKDHLNPHERSDANAHKK